MGDLAGLWHLFDAVLAVVAGAIAGGLATRFLVEPYKAGTQQRLAHVESDLSTERAERQGLLDRVLAQEAKRFDVLHEWRAKAMSDTYAALCDLEDAFDAFSRSFGGFVGGPTPMNFWEDLAKAGTSFRNAFWNKRILFDQELANDLTGLNRAYVEISNLYFAKYGAARGVLRGSGDTEEKRRQAEYDVLAEILRSDRYHNATVRIVALKEKIEDRFRSLFGVT